MIPLAEVLPQADPMILLSDYEEPESGQRKVTSHVVITRQSPFYDSALDGTPSATALEYMAQTMALCVGFDRRWRGLGPKIGFVIGSRKLETFVRCFKCGERYRVVAECTYGDVEFGSFDCEIRDAAGMVCARGTLTAFQPEGEMSPERLREYE